MWVLGAASLSGCYQEKEITVTATLVPTPMPEVVTLVPTPAPTVAPTPVPTPPPWPTPAFGPTGRPTDATRIYILTADETTKRPTVYSTKEGEELVIPYHYLDGRVLATYPHFSNPTYFGNPLVLRVLSGAPGDEWAEVQIPTRPIMTGWVKTDEFSWSWSDYYVQVNVATNTVTVWDGDDLLVEGVSVVTGSPGRETPLASTFVDEIIAGPSPAYGPWMLSLGVFSEAISTFGSAGGLPKVALHGTNKPQLLGQYASNGCIRLPNDVITLLAETVPVGSRVDIISRL